MGLGTDTLALVTMGASLIITLNNLNIIIFWIKTGVVIRRLGSTISLTTRRTRARLSSIIITRGAAVAKAVEVPVVWMWQMCRMSTTILSGLEVGPSTCSF
jgi:hypothetical protein